MMRSNATYFLEAEQLELGSEGDEVSKEGVEVTFAAQVDEVRELRVVDVREYPQ